MSKLDKREFSRIKYHYEVEKELAKKLLDSTSKERASLYTSLYNELFEKVIDHPQLISKNDKNEIKRRIRIQLPLLKKFINNDTVFVEVGAGDCSLSVELCALVKYVYALEVSNTISNRDSIPENLSLKVYDGLNVPIESNSIDMVYSNQLLEHLHPDDIVPHLNEILRILKRGGRFVCITPNKLSGPHDVSKYFDLISTGFHLKEYLIKDLVETMREIGFNKVSIYASFKGIYIPVPCFLASFLEDLITLLPNHLRRIVASLPILRNILGINLVVRNE